MMGWVLEDQSGRRRPRQGLVYAVLHDVVEIDAGDTFAYDETEHDDKAYLSASSGPDFWFAPADQAQLPSGLG